MKESLLYKILRPLTVIYTKVLIRPKYIGLENIPKEGKVLLVGTHTHIMDSFLLMSTTKRPIHFLAKKELWKFPTSIIMAHMGLIKVDRSKKCPESLLEAKKYLEDDKVVLIFPEGTIEKEHGELLPFKIGAFKLANDTNTDIIPFAISGNYYKKGLTIKFGKKVKIGNNLEEEKERFEKIIEDLRK